MNTITLAKLLRALINGNDYPAGTNIIINRKELVYCDNISWYNNLLYMHKETGSYLYVQHTDNENYVRINIILPNETLKDSYCKHHLADDFADNPYCWDKLDNDYESSEFTVEYKYEIS